MQEIKKFAFDVGWGFIGSIFISICGLLLSIVLARWLGPTNLGLYRIAISVQGITALIANFGIGPAIVKYVAEYKDNKEQLFQLCFSGIVNSIVFGIISSIVLVCLSGVIANIFKMNDLSTLLKLLAIVFPFSSVLQISMGILNGLRNMKAYALLVIIQNGLMVILDIILVGIGLSIQGAVIGLIIANIGACIFGLYLCRNFFRFTFINIKLNSEKLLLFGSKIFGTNIINLLTSQADILLIGYFLSAREAGYYSIAIAICTLISILPSAVQMITYPTTSEYWAQENFKTLQFMINKSIKYSLLILLPLGMIIGYLSKIIVGLIYGNVYYPAITPLYILLFGKIITGGIAQPVGGSFSGIGRPGLALLLDSITAIVAVILDVILIPYFGIIGAAVATSSAFLVKNLIFLVIAPRVLRIIIDLGWLVRIGLLSLIAIILFAVGAKFFNYYFVGAIIIFMFIFIIIIYFTTEEDRHIFKSLVSILLIRNKNKKTV